MVFSWFGFLSRRVESGKFFAEGIDAVWPIIRQHEMTGVRQADDLDAEHFAKLTLVKVGGGQDSANARDGWVGVGKPYSQGEDGGTFTKMVEDL